MYKLKTTVKMENGGGETGNYEYLENKPQINGNELVGNKTSADLGLQPAGQYLTQETDPVFTASPANGITSQDITNWNNKSDFSGSYNDLSNKPSIPSKTSDLNNDSGFITKDVNNLTNYYKSSETYTKTEVDNKISSVYKYKGTVSTYADLPSTSLTVGDVYNVETADPTHSISAGDNVAWNGTLWDKLSGNVDLSGYQTKIDSTHKLSSDLVDDTNNTNLFVTSGEKTTWNNKQDALTAGSNITINTSTGEISADLSSKQDTLVSGTNIKTINSTSVLGGGDITTEQVQYSTMPTASATNLGQIVQYTGTTTTTAPIYTNGHFYVCVSDGQTVPTYSWQEISFGGGSGDLPCYTITDQDIADMKEAVGYTIADTINMNMFYRTYGAGYFKFAIDPTKAYKLAISSNSATGGVIYNGTLMMFFPYINTSGTNYGGYMIIIGMNIILADTSYAITNNTTLNISQPYFSSALSNLRKLFDNGYIAKNNTSSYNVTNDYNPAHKKYVDDAPTTYTGYDATKTQTLKNINGVLTWVDD